jgi:hypothetical protein
MITLAWGRARRTLRLGFPLLRKLLVALAALLIVIAVFAAGAVVYDALLDKWTLLLAW